MITNQSGLALLDGLEDLNGRPLLQPDVVKPTDFRISGTSGDIRCRCAAGKRRIDQVSDSISATLSPTRHLFRRKAIEVAGTDVGGDAWRKYGYEVRAITRLDAVTFDSAAVKGVNFIHP